MLGTLVPRFGDLERRELQPPDDIDELTAVLSDGRVVDDQLSLRRAPAT